MSITSQAVGELAGVLAEVLITANTALHDEGVTDWAEGGRLGDALIAIRDAAETAVKTVGTQPITNRETELLGMLATLCNGIEWNIENHPTVMNESDAEALQEARELIAKVKGESPHFVQR